MRPLLLAASLALAGCGTPGLDDGWVHPGSTPPADAQEDPGSSAGQVLEEGLASWYGLPFHGRRTASGERFDMNALTAAHPSLPFGTRVLVRNPRNGRSVTVRINDRGPHVRGRIIDLSHAAAREIGLLALGVHRVVLMAAPSVDSPAAGR